MKRLLLLVFIILSASYADVEAQETRQKELLGLHYIPASYQSLSQATWRFGLHNLSDYNAIDEYMKVVNCPLYQDYFDNDFLWQRIREGIKRDIRYYGLQFPDRFEMVGGIELGRYDFRESAFVVPDQYKLSRAGHLEIPTRDYQSNKCITNARSYYFPTAMRLSVDNPFNLSHIPVAPDDARDLIKRLSKYKYRSVESTRMAVMRIRVRITGIKEYQADGVQPSITFRGQLDDVAVFEDPAMSKLIWQKTFKDLN